jgi:hypothetical protein
MSEITPMPPLLRATGINTSSEGNEANFAGFFEMKMACRSL